MRKISEEVNRYIKKPIDYIEAIQLSPYNKNTVLKFCNKLDTVATIDEELTISVKTSKGIKIVNTGDYIIKTSKGKISICKSDIFEATYTRCK